MNHIAINLVQGQNRIQKMGKTNTSLNIETEKYFF